MLDELAPVREARNRALPGDSDYGQPGPKKKKETKHAGKGPGGGRFISDGASGEDVRAVERGLGLQVTGTYTSGVIASVMAFQRKHGLKVDGVVGRQTAAALSGDKDAAKVAPGELTRRDRKRLRQRHQPKGGRLKSRSKSGTGARGGFLVEMEVDAPGAAAEAADLELGSFWLDSLEEADLDASWDEALHPRDYRGRFRKKLGKLTPRGQRGPTGLRLPDGTRVSKDPDGTYRVVRSGRIHSGFATRDAAVQDALDRSARGTTPESLGGATRYSDFNDFLSRSGSAQAAWAETDTLENLRGRLSRAQAEVQSAQTDTSTYGSRRRVAAAAAVRHLEHRIRQAEARGGSEAPPEPGIRWPKLSDDRLAVHVRRGTPGAAAEQRRRAAVGGGQASGLTATQVQGMSASDIRQRIVTLNGSLTSPPSHWTPADIETARRNRQLLRDEQVRRAGGGGGATPPAAEGFPSEMSVPATIFGQTVTLHLRAIPNPGAAPEVYETRDPIGIFQTRTGTNDYERKLRFQRVTDQTGHLPSRTPQIEVNGVRYALRRDDVARNRPATFRRVSTSANPERASREEMTRNFRENPIRLGAATPDAVSPRVAAPAAVQAQRSLLPGMDTLAQGNAYRIATRILATDTADFGQTIGTPLEAVGRSVVNGREYLYVRGRDGRSWSIDTERVSRGNFSAAAVQVRTQGGDLHTAPGMARYLHGVLGGTPPSQSATSRIPSTDQNRHPPAPAGSVAAHGASRSGPSPAIPSPAAQTAPGTAPQLVGAPDLAGPRPSLSAASGGVTPARAAIVNGIVAKLHGFSHEGLTTKISSVSSGGFSGVVLNRDGRQIGAFSRDLHFGSSDNPTFVYHSIFQIAGDARATGYGSKLIDRMFESYKEAGFKKVKVSAGLSSGGYQWAKMGFELTDSPDAAARTRALKEFFTYNISSGKKRQLTEENEWQTGGFNRTLENGETEAVPSQLHRGVRVPQALLDELERQIEEGVITSMSQLAAWGRRTQWTETREGKEHKMWLGKFLLLGTGWSGIKKL